MATYTLDANPATGTITIKVGASVDHTTPLGGLLSPEGGSYGTRAALIKDQKKVNYLDAIKDGTEVHQLTDLHIYDTNEANPIFPAGLHDYENKLLEKQKDNLLHMTWLKTKKDSQLNLIPSQYVFWESGLGYDSFIEVLDKGNAEMVTFGSYIDPLSKPGKTWPQKDSTIKIMPNFMEQFGFGLSSIEAKTLVKTINAGVKGQVFDYKMKIACGNGCTNPPCDFNDDGTKRVDGNEKYFKGNAAKNELVKTQAGNPGLKTKLIVSKGWGDKVQVMLYYMFYHLHQKNAIMTTCDFVVFCFCMTLDIPCVYTGVYNRPTVIKHREIAIAGEQRERKSYYSILHFNPGTPLDNARRNYNHTIDRIFKENQEFIANVESLFTNHNTGIDVGRTYPMIFTPGLYRLLADDMKQINELLNGEKIQVPQNDARTIEELLIETNNLKKKFLIVPMFKFIKTGTKIKFLQTKMYTSDNSITANSSIAKNPHNKPPTKTFYDFVSAQYAKQIPKSRGGASAAEREAARLQRAAKKAAEQAVREEAEAARRRDIQEYARLSEERFQHVASKREERHNILTFLASANHQLGMDTIQSFPQRDTTEKNVTCLAGDVNDNVKYEGDYKNNDGVSFLFSEFIDVDDIVNDDIDMISTDLQRKFDQNIYIAIEQLQQIDQENQNYNRGGGRRKATRRRQKGGGGVDETLFETLYTLYVYRAQYDIELDTHDQSINMHVLEELYKDYPKSALNVGRRMTLKNITGEKMITYTVTGGPVNTRTQSVNMRKQAIARYAQTHKRVNTPFHINSRPMVRSYGGQITRRKKRHHRTRK
jgi:hypothetical protein